MAIHHQPFDSTNNNNIPDGSTTTRHQQNESRVRVGVRIRPQTSTEIHLGGKSSLTVAAPSIRMGKRQFTFDAVFDSACGQADLYDTVSTPLLSSFVDGYNATVSSTKSLCSRNGVVHNVLHCSYFMQRSFISLTPTIVSFLTIRSSLMGRQVRGKPSPWEVRHILNQRHLVKPD
jgi:hypothetical protein